MQGDEILYSDTIIKAIYELHKIEISIFNLWKQLPDLQIIDNNSSKHDERHMTFEEWQHKNMLPRVSNDSDYTDEENGQYYWGLHTKYKEYVNGYENNSKARDINN